MLSVKRKATIEACETYLTEIEHAAGERLLLASNLKHTHCGGIASLIQVINTWSRSCADADPTLLTHAQPPYNERTIYNLVETLPGLVSVLMSGEVLARDAETSLRLVAYEDARHRVEAMDERRLRDTAKGIATTLICADHTSKRALQPFYHSTTNGGAVIRGESDFIDLAEDLMATALGQARRRDFEVKDVEAVGVMLRELFSNTHFHARSDAVRGPYRRSVRGVHLAQHALENSAEVAGDFEPLARYLETVLERPRLSARAKLLEISIFDSGPGYAARRAGKRVEEDLPLNMEYELVRECLLRNVSTRNEEGAGIGLPRMLSRLKGRGGFLRLRTGRLSLFKSFADAEGSGLVDADFELDDARTAGGGFTRHAPAVGAVVTLLMPIGR